MSALLALIESFLFWLGLRRSDERLLAAEARQGVVDELRGAITEDERLFAAEMERRRLEPHLVIGRAGTVDYLLPLRDMIGAHAHVVAQPGAGKTRFIVALITQVLEHMWLRGASHAVIAVDPKGETVLLLMRAVAELLARLPAELARDLSRRITTIRPFLGNFLTPIDLLAREPSVDLIAQARTTVELIERTAGAAVGIRQGTAGTFAFATLIANGVSLVEAPFLLRNPTAMRYLASRVDEPRLRSYFEGGDYERESRTTLHGLLARTEVMVGIAPLRAMSAGPGGLDFRTAFAPGMLTIVDLDGAPLGAQSIAEAIGALLLTRIAWAAFAQGGERAAGTWLVIDELGRLASPSVLDVVERILTQGRWRGLGLTSVAQFAQQLPELDRLLSANTRWRSFGRSSAREIEGAASEWLPITGRRLRPRRPGEPSRTAEFMTEAEEVRDWVRRIARLPQRHFLFADRSAPFASRVVVAPTMAPAPWHEIPAEVRELVERGGFGLPREELLARARRLESDAADRLMRTREQSPPREGRRRGQAVEQPLPDLAERTRSRRRRREVP